MRRKTTDKTDKSKPRLQYRLRAPPEQRNKILRLAIKLRWCSRLGIDLSLEDEERDWQLLKALISREKARAPKKRGRPATDANFYESIAVGLASTQAKLILDGELKAGAPFPIDGPVEGLAHFVRGALRLGDLSLIGRDDDIEDSVKYHTNALRKEIRKWGINVPAQHGGYRPRRNPQAAGRSNDKKAKSK